MKFSLYNLYVDLRAKGILLSYSGPMNQISLEAIGDTLRRNLELEAINSTTKFSVFSVFVEQVQNVLNYSSERLAGSEGDESPLRVGIVVIGYEDNGDYFVCCGNRVFNQDIPRMKESIENIRGLDKNELKVLYKERRKAEPHPTSKGAGLGLIEMARKAAQPFEYAFVSIDDQYSFFSIKVVVGR